MQGGSSEDEVVAPYIFKIVPEGGGVRFVGGQAEPSTIRFPSSFTETVPEAGEMPAVEEES